MIMIGVIIVTIFMGALLIFSIYMDDNSTNDFYNGWWIGFSYDDINSFGCKFTFQYNRKVNTICT